MTSHAAGAARDSPARGVLFVPVPPPFAPTAIVATLVLAGVLEFTIAPATAAAVAAAADADADAA